jgi:hypothetical protein
MVHKAQIVKTRYSYNHKNLGSSKNTRVHVVHGRKASSSFHQRNPSLVVMSTHSMSTETFGFSQLDLPLRSCHGGGARRKDRTVSSSCSRRLMAIASAGD